MGRRRKVLKTRVYTFGQCDTLAHRHYTRRKSASDPLPVRLYGNVELSADYRLNYFTIRYWGTRLRFTLARVYRASDGDTLYEVFGVGHPAAASVPPRGDKRGKVMAQWRKVWKRFAPAFTPVTSDITLGAIVAGYRLRGGIATECGVHAGYAPPGGDPQGVWLARPACYQMKKDAWTAAFKTYPNFARRASLFVTNIKKSLTNDKMGVVQLLSDAEEHLGSYWRQPGVCLHVCTPPTAAANGRRLVVKMAVHDKESRTHFHVDGDYAIKHNQFFALEDGKKRSEMLRWKCSSDAVAGIREWIFGDIYIPGPD